MDSLTLSGLTAATFTPMNPDGSIWYEQIGPLVEHLQQSGVSGLYVCGSTGEGISMTSAERRLVAESFVAAARPHGLPVVVQVGHNSLREARELARHAGEIGATAISANAPSYFKVTAVDDLVECARTIATGSPDLPFYYYHIPHLTGARIDMIDFLERAASRIPNLAGIKFTAPTIHEYQLCVEWNGGQYDILWGSDEMLLSALSIGARGAVGSTYNIAAPLYRRVIDSFDEGDLNSARNWMGKAVRMVRSIYNYPFHAACKAVLEMQGVACGPCRLPLGNLQANQVESLRRDLDAIGFFDWSD